MPNVMDIAVSGKDTLGQTITIIYGRKAPAYAVYGADRRVMICYADAPDEEDKQRKLLSQLAPLRGEIEGLIDGWRDGRGRSFLGTGVSTQLISKADRYNRRVADALVVALEGDLITAGQILDAIKQEILKERTATARFEYLITALFAALAVLFVAWMIAETLPFSGEQTEAFRTRNSTIGWICLLLGGVAALGYAFLRSPSLGAHADKKPPPPYGPIAYRQLLSLFLFALFAIPITAIFLLSAFVVPGDLRYAAEATHQITLWQGAGAGAVGAFFSIALGIRSRTVLPDIVRTSNLLDATLRVIIGLLSGAILLSLFGLHVVQVNLGGVAIDGSQTLGIIMIGFLAGFSERLVPDLLDKANAQPGAPASQTPSMARAVQSAASDAEIKRADAADKPAPSPPLPTEEPEVTTEEAGSDCCASDQELPDDLVTDDANLPPASGGVAKTDDSTTDEGARP